MDPGMQNRQALSAYEQLSSGRRMQIMMTVAIGTFMATLDSSVVNIALPSIRIHFNASLSLVEWVIMAYLLVISSLLLIFGKLGDLYGHKCIYVSGFAVFTAGSVLCALAPTVTFLIIFRALQAIGAGMLMSMGPAIVTNTSPPHERGKYLGMIAISVSVGLTSGPVVGGILTAKFGWPSIFFINVPIGILAILLSQKVIPETGVRTAQPFDIKGAVTLFFTLTAILLPLNYAEKLGWYNPLIWGVLAAGIVLLAIFISIENKAEYPMVDMSLFRNRLFSMANLSALLSYISIFAVVLILPFYLQQLRGIPPDKAGLLMIPMPLTSMIVAPIAGIISDRIDTRYISALGMLITSVGLWLLSRLHMDSSVVTIIISMVTIGFGASMFQTPNNSAIMGAVPPNRRGIASGLLAAMRNVGMVFGVAISGAVFNEYNNYLTKTLAVSGISGSALKVQAFTGALNLTFVVAASIAAAAVVTSLIRGRVENN
jgi:EmrB/QacA subfamily drug resistance transporter